MGTNVDRAIESVVNEFERALHDGAAPNLHEFTRRAPTGTEAKVCGLLLASAFRVRAEKGERPSIDEYLSPLLWHYRKEVCEALTIAFYKEYKGNLAAKLGMLEFGRYRAEQIAGFGGSGVILKARHNRDSENVVAVKLAHRRTESAQVMLGNELRVLKEIQAKNLAGVPALRDPGMYKTEMSFLVTDWVEGKALDVWRADGQPTFALLEASRQIARIVRDLHRAGCYHGDLSPSNILVSENSGSPTVTLVDYGNSGIGFVANRLEAVTGRYAAPELLLGTTAGSSAATDMWSLGVVLFELLSGSHPFGLLPDDMTPRQLGEHFRKGRVGSFHTNRALWRALASCLIPDGHTRTIEAGELLAAIPDAMEYESPAMGLAAVPSVTAGPQRAFDGKRAPAQPLDSGTAVVTKPGGNLVAEVDATRRKTRVWSSGAKRISMMAVLGVALGAVWVSSARKSDSGIAMTAQIPSSLPGVVNSIGMEFKLIPAGVFTMGSPDDEHAGDDAPGHHANDEKQRAITLRRPFYMSVHDVTRGQFAQFYREMNKDRPYRTAAEMVSTTRPVATWQQASFEQHDDHPVVVVSWVEAVAFTKWLSKKEGNTYRLPLEAEWEYACRANAPVYSMFNTGNKLLPNEANFGKNYQGTTSVDKFHANAWGLRDMHGNVWQWCLDRLWNPPSGVVQYPDEMGPDNDRTTPRIARGGAWSSEGDDCRSANHYGRNPDDYSTDIGFRVVAELPFKSRK